MYREKHEWRSDKVEREDGCEGPQSVVDMLKDRRLRAGRRKDKWADGGARKMANGGHESTYKEGDVTTAHLLHQHDHSPCQSCMSYILRRDADLARVMAVTRSRRIPHLQRTLGVVDTSSLPLSPQHDPPSHSSHNATRPPSHSSYNTFACFGVSLS